MDQHILTFVTVVEKKSFTRAAEALLLTQSAVSRQIEALEVEYGARLLDRTNKFVRPTRAGEILFYHSKNIVNEYERAVTLIQDLTNKPVGKLCIGSSYTFGEYMLPHIISSFKKTYPLVTPKITIMNSKRILNQVVKREVDLGIVEGPTESKDITMHPFAQDEMLVIVPPDHKLALVKEITIDELSSETWILRELGSGTRDITDRVFNHLHFTPESVMEFGSTQIIKESVRAGLGVAVASKFAIQHDLKFRFLHALRIKDYPIYRHFYSVTNISEFRTKTVDLFLNFLHQWSYPS